MPAVDEFGGDGIGAVGLVSCPTCVAKPGLAPEGDEFEPVAAFAVVEAVAFFAVAT
jgi:hypothetical protein